MNKQKEKKISKYELVVAGMKWVGVKLSEGE